MDKDALRAVQAPIKERYRAEPGMPRSQASRRAGVHQLPGHGRWFQEGGGGVVPTLLASGSGRSVRPALTSPGAIRESIHSMGASTW